MSLHRGVSISTIEEHLALLFVVTVRPDRQRHAFETVFESGKKVAREVIKPLSERYPDGFNTDYVEGEAFSRRHVAKLEDEIMGIADKTRIDVLDRATLFSDAELERRRHDEEEVRR